MILDLEKIIDEKDLEIKVLNQMIVSANKMVQVKSTEFKRLKRKFDSQSRVFVSLKQNLEASNSKKVSKKGVTGFKMLENITRITKDNRMKGLTSSTSYVKKRFKNLRITSSNTKSHRRFKRPLEKIPPSLLKKKEEIKQETERAQEGDEEHHDEDEGSRNDPNAIINDVESNAGHVLVTKERDMDDYKRLVDDKIEDVEDSDEDYEDELDY